MDATTSGSGQPSASSGAAPAGRRTGGSTFNSTDWNFTYGAGPSHSSMYYAEDKERFKPGWDTKRRKDVINPDSQRVKEEQFKTNRQTVTSQMRHDALDSKRTFNPITGQERTPTGGWAPANDPWQHQKLGLKPVQAGREVKETQATKLQAERQVIELRRGRMVAEGVTRGSEGSVADALKWQ